VEKADPLVLARRYGGGERRRAVGSTYRRSP